MKRERILGIPFDCIGVKETLLQTEKMLRKERSHIIIHLSLPTLMMARKSKFLRIFLEEADIVIPSGKYVLWAAKVLKRSVKESIDPSLFVKMLMIQSVELNKTVYLFGGKEGTVDKAFTNLKKEIPNLFVIGKCRGNYPKHVHDDVVQAIGKASPDYFFIGIGSPREENWVERNRKKINAKLIILIGGLFDVFAGSVKRSRSYREFRSYNGAVKREIQHHKAFRKLWWVPLFIISVYIERLFWTH